MTDAPRSTPLARAGGPLRPMTPGVSRAARLRAYFAGGLVIAGLCGVASRAWSLQIDDGDKYRALAERQHETLLQIPAPRGEILDAKGRPLAVSADVDSIWANPRDIQDVTATAEKLAKLGVGGDASSLEARLGGDHRFVWLARHVAPEIGKALRDAKLPGVEVAREPRRWYPGRALTGPVIGRADTDGNGLDGLELSMNELLAGRRGQASAIRDARGHRVLADGLGTSFSEAGATVQVSLDRSVQAIADQALAAQMTAEKAKNGVVVVLDVETSRVLAMASYPTYDPNVGDPHGARNRPVTDSYEAGSVMKVFSISTALDDGVITPETEIDTQGGVFKIGPNTVRDDDHDGILDVGGIIKRSSNVGASKIALRLGRDKLYDGLHRFGFGSKTGIELPGETHGHVREGKWRDIELATISYGYGVMVSPLQLAAAFATLARGGTYIEPRIVDRVTDADGSVLYEPHPDQHRAVSEGTAAAMMKMLAGVFDRDPLHGGTAKSVVVPGFVCAGKTGTARKWDPTVHQYSTTRYLSSFAGIAPLDHPKIVVVVMIDEASNGDYFGATVSGPVFATVASETLRYLGVHGDALPPPPAKPAPAHPAKAPPAITAPAPEPAAEIAADATPDFRGLGVGKALDAARAHHLTVEVHGTGRVVAQDPAPGAPVAATVSLRFEP